MAWHSEPSGAMVWSPDCKCSTMTYCFQFHVVSCWTVLLKKPLVMSWLITCNHVLPHGVSTRPMWRFAALYRKWMYPLGMEASISIPCCFTSWFRSSKVVRPNHLKIVALSVKFMKSLHLAGMAQSPKLRELSLKEKVQLIKESKGKSQRALGEIFKVGKTQMQQILKGKAEYMTSFEENSPMEKKRICLTTKHHSIDEMKWKWFQRTRTASIPVYGSMIQANAISFVQTIGQSEFKASNGWLSRFKFRHNINCAKICGESGSVNQMDVDEWLRKLPSIVSRYEHCDIFSMDDSGIFYRALQTLRIKGEECKGRKRSKERITASFCVNMEWEFEETLVTGRTEKPRSFKNVSVTNLPVHYKHNKKAWTTTGIFSAWLKRFDRKMRAKGRKVVLLLDNASLHDKHLHLTNVKL